MGTRVGHLVPGMGFLLIGLWHLFNHTKLHSLRPNSYIGLPWFPTPTLRYSELFVIICGGLASITVELFTGPRKHQPLDDDGTIPSNHLHNFEHSCISLSIIVYAGTAIALDRARPPHRVALTLAVGTLAFAQELLLFHLHSTDHTGVEGQFHWLFQLIIFLSMATTLLGIPFPRSFTIAFTRSASIAFQGLWMIVLGYAIWTPSLNAKGCFLVWDDGRQVLQCHDDASLYRAKSLVNILFSFFVSGFAVFLVLFYLFMVKKYPQEPEYAPLVKDGEEEDYLESEKKLGESQWVVHVDTGLRPMEVEK